MADMGTEKLITVVLPVYNRAAIVMRTLDSIEAQTSNDFHLIIIDNASTDNTFEVLNKWVDKHQECSFKPKLLSEPTPGAAAARNRGLAVAKTPYVMFFDSDDEMRYNHITRVADHLRRFPNTDLLRWNTSFIDSDGWLSTHDKQFHDEMQLHLMHATLATQRFAIRTDIAKNIGGWNQSLSTFDDLEFGVRLIATGCKIQKLHGEPTVLIHHSEECISGNSYSCRVNEIDYALDTMENILREQDLSDDLKILNAKRAIAAAHLKREKNHTAAARFLEKALNSINRKHRQHIKTIYHTVRLFGKGGCFIALKLLGKKAEVC